MRSSDAGALPSVAKLCAWNAQLRLIQRFVTLNVRGVQANMVCIAVARELAGFIWAIGMRAQSEEIHAT